MDNEPQPRSEPDLDVVLQPFAADPAPPATPSAPTPFGHALTPQDVERLADYHAATPLFRQHVEAGLVALLTEFKALGYVVKYDLRADKLRGAVTRYLTESQQ
ncbi:hypothetical protein RN01_30415 [Cupriavidus sp. SHE]|uniref:hypothetical protein n=1 Tax=Cupriavidus TaxID=106589 RepID=UPI00046B6F45|nr:MULTISPECIES: hypothetical protein [Cupriavidus]KWR74523.1 hypothetical protein RN01_30415 [Cupriavidus sp. SHE]